MRGGDGNKLIAARLSFLRFLATRGVWYCRKTDNRRW